MTNTCPLKWCKLKGPNFYSKKPCLVLYFLLLHLWDSFFILHVTHTLLSIFFYSFTKSFLHLQIFWHNAASWQRTGALVSQRQLSAGIVITQCGVKKFFRLPVGTTLADSSHKPRQGRHRQTQKAWRVYEKAAGESRDEHRQASIRSTVPLTSMHGVLLLSAQLKAKQISWRERFIWRSH